MRKFPCRRLLIERLKYIFNNSLIMELWIYGIMDLCNYVKNFKL